jgi:hypothetical protein
MGVLDGLLEDVTGENIGYFLMASKFFMNDFIEDKRLQQIFDKLLEPDVTWDRSQLQKLFTIFIQMDPEYHQKHEDYMFFDAHIKGATFPPITLAQVEK